jgi:hypothetical protein
MVQPWARVESSAASIVLTSSMVMVIGPTPPGTGVIQPATFAHSVEVDVAAQLAFVVAVHADVDAPPRRA